MTDRAAALDNRCGKIIGGTFYSYANLVLCKYANKIGLESEFKALDQSDSEDAMSLLRSQLNLHNLKKRSPQKKHIKQNF